MPGADSPRPEDEIFVSYSKDDAARVQVLVAAIEREGWKVFWDQEILPGEDWESYIGVHLDAAPVVIPVWSEPSVTSRYVRSEVNRANRRKPNVLVPVLIDAVEPPFGLDHIQAADLVRWLADGGGVLPARLKSSILRRIPLVNAASTSGAAEEVTGGQIGHEGRGAPQTDDELEQARQARQEAERELAVLKAQIEAQRQASSAREAQRAAAAQLATEEAAQRQAEAEAIAQRHAEEEAQKRAAAASAPGGEAAGRTTSYPRPGIFERFRGVWEQPFARGYVGGATLAGVLVGFWFAVLYPKNGGIAFLACLGLGGGGAMLSALIWKRWPGYHVSDTKLVLAALLLNPVIYLLLLPMAAAASVCFGPARECEADMTIAPLGFVLLVAAAMAGVLFRRRQSAERSET